jgi:putative ABC transport system substrate-binding protein
LLPLTRRQFLARAAAGSGGVLFARRAACADRTRRIRRIGLATGDDPEGGVDAFKKALGRLGHVEGENLKIEAREARSMPPGMNAAAELARLNLELLVVHSLPFALAARDVNPDMPLVVVTTPGFVVNGFAQSLERPRGNVTGIDELPPGVTGRRLELLKTAAPGISRVALLSTTPGQGAHELQLADAQETAPRLNLAVKPYRASTVPQLDEALTAAAADGMDGLLNFQGALSYIHRSKIVEFVAENRMPAIYQATVFARAGGLMTWAPDLVDQFRDAAHYVDAILRGAHPGDLPIKHPSRYYLTLNNTAARGLGMSFPAQLLSLADTVLP